jgi:hypothetical protein
MSKHKLSENGVQKYSATELILHPNGFKAGMLARPQSCISDVSGSSDTRWSKPSLKRAEKCDAHFTLTMVNISKK